MRSGHTLLFLNHRGYAYWAQNYTVQVFQPCHLGHKEFKGISFTSFVFPSFPVTTSARTHTHTHTYTHTHTHTTHTQLTHNSHTTHTQLTHNSHTTHHHTTYSHLLFQTQLTPPQSFTISFLFPTFPMPSLPFFYCLLEEVDMWGYPVL